jgi:hypothetical protein
MSPLISEFNKKAPVDNAAGAIKISLVYAVPLKNISIFCPYILQERIHKMSKVKNNFFSFR